MHTLRDCLELLPAGGAIPIEEVQPAAEIMTRFCTGACPLLHSDISNWIDSLWSVITYMMTMELIVLMMLVVA